MVTLATGFRIQASSDFGLILQYGNKCEWCSDFISFKTPPASCNEKNCSYATAHQQTTLPYVQRRAADIQ